MRYIFLTFKITLAALAILFSASSSHASHASAEGSVVVTETGRCKIIEVKKAHWNRIILIDGQPVPAGSITGMYLNIERARAIPGGGSSRTYIYTMFADSLESTLLMTREAAQIALDGLLNRRACD